MRPFTTLIDAATLHSLLERDDLALFDCRSELGNPQWGEAEYRKSHLPGARYLHLDRDLSSAITATSGRHPLPNPEDFARRLGQLGVGPDSQIVGYDQALWVAGLRHGDDDPARLIEMFEVLRRANLDLWARFGASHGGRLFRENVRGHLRFLAKHRGPREAERARTLMLAALRLRGLLFHGERGRQYRDAAHWLASGDVQALLAADRRDREPAGAPS